jgi:hypothetical protein
VAIPEEAGMRRLVTCAVVALSMMPFPAAPQHTEHAEPAPSGAHDAGAHHAGMEMVPAPLDVPASREGSGTSWLPDGSPMNMLAWRSGRWELDAMWNVFLQYLSDEGPRGLDQLGSVNWAMAMVRRSLGEGQLRGRAMISLESLTVGRCGYPDLLATGELCRGEPLHDRQHPHDTWMELSAGYAFPIALGVALDLYAALSGEPALGPVAFPHRPSAMPSPIAPMTHHWLDSSHISFGVVTAGVYGRRWKIEGSAFNGREPDEHRYDVDLAPLDSFSGRIWFLPDPHWSLQASGGFLREAEAGIGVAPRTDVTRTTASATHHRSAGSHGVWATTAAWGRNAEHGQGTNAVLLESVLDPDERNVLFARIEAAEKSAEALAISERSEDVRWVGKAALTYVRQLPIGLGPGRALLLGLGIGLSLNAVPRTFETAYGGRWPAGFSVFLSARPAPMAMGAR